MVAGTNIKDLAEECARQAIAFGVNAHFLVGVAQFRSGTSDDANGSETGPFRLSQEQWDRNRIDKEFKLEFQREEIRDWGSQCAVFARMVLSAQRAYQSEHKQQLPSAVDLYLMIWPSTDPSRLAQSLGEALKETALYVANALERQFESPTPEVRKAIASVAISSVTQQITIIVWPEKPSPQTDATPASPETGKPATGPSRADVDTPAAGDSSPSKESPEIPPEETTSTSSKPLPNDDSTRFVADDAELEQDELGRGVLAIALARRIHKIWCSLNGVFPPGAVPRSAASAPWSGNIISPENWFFDRTRDNTRAAFVMHLDAPWGGGKTTFANFLARVMNPYGFELGTDSFLHRRYGDISKRNIGALFLQDPPSQSDKEVPDKAKPDTPNWHVDARRPWIIVQFNAWQVEHCAPPWWVFYQAIRKRCFASILCEGNAPVDLASPNPPVKPSAFNRWKSFAGLWAREYRWRLTNPKVLTLLATALTSFALLGLLRVSGILKPSGTSVAFDVSTGVGALLAGITAIGTIWGLGALITESIVPGTNTLAERLSLGSGDPFERFRGHFHRSIERLKRPVMVIVDDLDRCKPEFIVDIVRGIQTLLRSPRVVFVILGDRDWIERAFEAHHKAMSAINVGPEQTFGARFVEKAIQMSFVLPGMEKNQQSEYVRHLLLGRNAPRPKNQDRELNQEVAAKLRESVQKAAEARPGHLFEPKQVHAEIMTEYAKLQQSEKLADSQLAEQAIGQLVKDELAIHTATSEKAEAAISHRLEPLANYFPANPRQIKRIINAVTMYHAVSLQQTEDVTDKKSDGEENPDRWFQLALWIIIMTEWPETWRVLASCPDIADLLRTPDEDIKKIPGSPLTAEAIRAEVDRIGSDPALMALIAAKDRPGPALDTAAIIKLLSLTPLYRKVRLGGKVQEKAKASAG